MLTHLLAVSVILLGFAMAMKIPVKTAAHAATHRLSEMVCGDVTMTIPISVKTSRGPAVLIMRVFWIIERSSIQSENGRF